MIDMNNEQLVPLRAVPRLLPRRRSGKTVHISAVYRWIQRGVRGVQLEAVRVGGTTYTSLEALQRFAERTVTRSNHREAEPAPSRKKSLQRADTELDRLLGADSAARSKGKRSSN